MLSEVLISKEANNPTLLGTYLNLVYAFYRLSPQNLIANIIYSVYQFDILVENDFILDKCSEIG